MNYNNLYIIEGHVRSDDVTMDIGFGGGLPRFEACSKMPVMSVMTLGHTTYALVLTVTSIKLTCKFRSVGLES